MFKFRNKSFLGLVFGIALLLVLSWISFQFNISGGAIFIGFLIFSAIFGFGIALINNNIFESNGKPENNYLKIDDLVQNLKDTEDEIAKKDYLINNSKNIKFELADLRNLIKNSGIKDDEFWIDFFVKNISQIPMFSLDKFYGFLYQLKSDNSRIKLKDILKSKGILTDEMESEYNASIRRRFNI